MNKNTIFAILLIITMVSLFFLSNKLFSHQTELDLQKTKLLTLTSSMELIHKELTLLTEKQSSMHQQISSLSDQVKNISLVKPSTAISTTQQKIDDSRKSQPEKSNKISKGEALDRLAEKMRNGENYTESIKKTFDKQSINSDWAIEYEQNVVNLFTIEPSLSSVSIKSVQCKTSICKLEVYPHPNTKSFNFSHDLAKSLSKASWTDPSANFIFNHTPVDGVLTFYLGKDSESLVIK